MSGTLSSSLPAVEIGQRTDPGRDPTKQVNEDACGHRETPFGHLAVVCDGMGGHEAGREASQLALQTILDKVASAQAGAPPADVLRDAILEANARVHAMSASNHGRPGSTVVALLVHKDGAEVAHCGDSRVYLIQKGTIQQITKDHSLVQQLVDAGVLTPEQAAKHPDANKISRALGIDAECEVEVRPQPVNYLAGDAFILCSDGLSDLVTPEDILKIAGTAPPAQAAGQLVDLANARGGHDNVTVQIVKTRESAQGIPPSLAPTIAQTMVNDGAATASGSHAVHPTIADAPPLTQRGPHGTQPLAAPLPAARIPASTTQGDGPSPRRGTIALWVGVVLGVAGIAIAALAIYILETQRHRSRSAPAFVDASLTFVDGGGAPTELQTTTIPPSNVPDEDASTLPGLVPSADASGHGPMKSPKRHR